MLDIIKELTHRGLSYNFSGSDWVRVFCPVHEKEGENNPSGYISTKENKWHCKACPAKGDHIGFFCGYVS